MIKPVKLIVLSCNLIKTLLSFSMQCKTQTNNKYKTLTNSKQRLSWKAVILNNRFNLYQEPIMLIKFKFKKNLKSMEMNNRFYKARTPKYKRHNKIFCNPQKFQPLLWSLVRNHLCRQILRQVCNNNKNLKYNSNHLDLVNINLQCNSNHQDQANKDLLRARLQPNHRSLRKKTSSMLTSLKKKKKRKSILMLNKLMPSRLKSTL